MKIIIETVPMGEMRYRTVGDYFVDADGTRHIKIASMSSEKREIMVAVHEIIEQELCLQRNIPEETITEFDVMFERERVEQHWGDAEPGDDPRACYRKEHFFATNIERQLCLEFGDDWAKYNDECALL